MIVVARLFGVPVATDQLHRRLGGVLPHHAPPALARRQAARSRVCRSRSTTCSRRCARRRADGRRARRGRRRRAPTATRMLDCLARDGLVERRRSEADRRVRARLAHADGPRARAGQARTTRRARRRRIFETLEPEEREQAGALLDRLSQAPWSELRVKPPHALRPDARRPRRRRACRSRCCRRWSRRRCPAIQREFGASTTAASPGCSPSTCSPRRSRRRCSAGSATCSARSAAA